MKISWRTFLPLFIFFPALLAAQARDSVSPVKDSVNIADSIPATKDSLAAPAAQVVRYDSALAHFLKENRFLKTNVQAAIQLVQPKKTSSRDHLFYLIAGLALVLGCLRYFYARYLTTLFRVFFNSSLRQSQLTDQLLQAKLPSLLFNIFFVIAGGFFVYLLLLYYNWTTLEVPWWLFLPGCIAAVAVIYTVKYFTLKFTGWITGYSEPADTYIFIIFLINKIIGILLVPVIVLMAFSQMEIIKISMILAFFTIAILLIFRFFRSYGLLQGRLQVSRLHFFLYIIGIEILPILMIYKGLMLYLNKSV